MIDMQQVAPTGADICYGILSRYKQVAPDRAHACPRENGELINFQKTKLKPTTDYACHIDTLLKRI